MKPLVLIRGTRYYIEYQIPTVNRVPMCCIGTYLGDADASHTTAQLSFRPKAGTSTIRKDYILTIEETTAPHQLPQKANTRR